VNVEFSLLDFRSVAYMARSLNELIMSLSDINYMLITVNGGKELTKGIYNKCKKTAVYTNVNGDM